MEEKSVKRIVENQSRAVVAVGAHAIPRAEGDETAKDQSERERQQRQYYQHYQPESIPLRNHITGLKLFSSLLSYRHIMHNDNDTIRILRQ